MQAYILSVYGDRVEIAYHDAAHPGVQHQFADIVAEAEKQNWPYPLVLIDGTPVMAGHVDAYGLMQMLDETLSKER